MVSTKQLKIDCKFCHKVQIGNIEINAEFTSTGNHECDGNRAIVTIYPQWRGELIITCEKCKKINYKNIFFVNYGKN